MKVRQRFYIMIVMQKIMRSFSFSKMTGDFLCGIKEEMVGISNTEDKWEAEFARSRLLVQLFSGRRG